jgi:hypothetical protein
MLRRRVLAAAGTLAVAVGLVLTPATDANAVTKIFYGYGYLPSDAHSAAVANMTAYSSSCVEVSTSYSSAGSMHYWKATLTANC